MNNFEYSNENKAQDIKTFWQNVATALSPIETACEGDCASLNDGHYCDECNENLVWVSEQEQYSAGIKSAIRRARGITSAP